MVILMRRVGIAGLLSLSLLLGGCSLLTSGTDTTSSTTSQQSESVVIKRPVRLVIRNKLTNNWQK